MAMASLVRSSSALLRLSARRATAMPTLRALSSSFPETYPIDEEKTVNVFGKVESPYSKGKHRSNGLELISKQPVIEVDGDMAVCDGGGGALGHPLEYINVGHKKPGESVPCIYCGLRFRKKAGAH
mmetsp:Transcript_43338/g.131857  ORF Transcript_43338/g.131857 Transcript_43338/m.131857 type:complete len:126 (-) Transcript_43338:407-784(-)|eukprot:CAMPEP_0113555804 /NCGR_PEP_ID=MMETSP0015_2-20120614/16916_1 /TAXON_ID=2838 /ORGANISM="Odontella" /LENGTH=125 /DNA_ID=CAMNT_0000457113 /DNA_START=27 /DNA_END=404 /DNA_ORIENTATION=- /assembly_acc=CAM_ASM_000160